MKNYLKKIVNESSKWCCSPPPKYCLLALAWMSIISCATQELLESDDLEDNPTTPLNWDHLVDDSPIEEQNKKRSILPKLLQDSKKIDPNPAKHQPMMAGGKPNYHAAFYSNQNPSYLMQRLVAEAKPHIYGDLSLYKGFTLAILFGLIERHEIEDPMLFFGGILGKKGPAKIFLSAHDNFQQYNQLYWVIGQVLSKCYGCFMTSKLSWPDKLIVTCRDHRQILFWYQQGLSWIGFIGRQFDLEGYEITVENHQILRISQHKMI